MLQFPGGHAQFDTLYQKLDTLLQTGKGHISILHIGGSHVQAGYMSHRLRTDFATLADSVMTERGLLFPLRILRTNVPQNYRISYSGHWESTRCIKPDGRDSMGIAGAAIGSSLAELVSVVFFVVYTCRRVDLVKYGLNRPVRYSWPKLRRILNVSFWTMIQNFISLSTWFLFFLFVEHLGERALAITNVIRNISGIPFMVVAAFASTCSALVSNLIGAGREDAVMPTIRQHVRLTYLIVLPMVVLFAIFPRVILGVYTNIPDLITAAIPSLWVYCTTPLLIAPGNIYFQAVSGTGNTRMAFALELFTLCFYTLYIYVIIQHLRFDVAWCWTSEHVYGLCILLLCYGYMRRGRWKLGKI